MSQRDIKQKQSKTIACVHLFEGALASLDLLFGLLEQGVAHGEAHLAIPQGNARERKDLLNGWPLLRLDLRQRNAESYSMR